MRKITTQTGPFHHDVLDVASSWPGDQPLALLHSGGDTGPWARWSVLASPRGHLRVDPKGYKWNGPPWPALEQLLSQVDSDDPLAMIDAAVLADRSESIDPGIQLPFAGGWLVSLRYELGGAIEPSARSDGYHLASPLADLLWCPDALVHDGHAGRWWQIGDTPEPAPVMTNGTPLHLDCWSSLPDRAGFESSVQKTIELIRRGDLFQANIARQLSTTCTGDLRSFALDALANSGAWFGGWLELPDTPLDRAVLSLSPELFLDLDSSTGLLRTRPIKGTRSIQEAVGDLADSEKDAAELNMIVDLMRNDLGRVCTMGSVEVSQTRTMETHPTVHHGVAEVRGHLRKGAGISDILQATFPPGSVTGAPKIRAMQVINELEAGPRGPYCGAMGCLSSNGDLRLGVSIRTASFEGRASRGFNDVNGTLTYGTGCGIVADSDPGEEFRESEHKAAALMNLSTPAGSSLTT